jgi:ABC-type lipoprotein release transport system permease subunit
MNVILTIALRNLVRQKRRNILLGSAIAFGTMILIVAHSFSHGISDVLFNQIVAYVAGHVSVGYSQGGNLYKQVFHDGDRMIGIVKKELPDVTHLQEAIGMFARALGNGKSDNVIMVGVDLRQTLNVKRTPAEIEKEQEEYKQNFHMVEGDFLDLKKDNVENPVAVSVEKAKSLNVKKGDDLRVRFSDINGQNQAARLTVVAIFKPANMFMSAPIFLDVTTLKKLLGYGPHDISQLYLRIKDARKFAARDADLLYKAMQPPPAALVGTIAHGTKRIVGTALGMRSDSASRRFLTSSFAPAMKGDSASAFGKEGVIASAPLAAALGLVPGDTVSLTYKTKYGPRERTVSFAVRGIAQPTPDAGAPILLVNEKAFFSAYYEDWPAPPEPGSTAYVPKKGDNLFDAYDPEWLLLPRSHTSDEARKAMRDAGSSKFKGTIVNVGSMYEMASDVLKLEYVLNMITFAAVIVLFFIILVGVINTLRMTIRERTREIGTVRAIGMQKKDVRNSFLLETGFLALFSSVAGTILGFVTMAILSLIKINALDNPLGMLLVDSHLNFAPTPIATIGFNALIVAIAVCTAFFPARRAANMSAASAFRHYE